MNTSDKANGAQRIKSDPVFDVLMNEIKQEQINVFMLQGSNALEREQAHNMVVAIELILNKFDSAIAAQKMELKQDSKKK